MSRGGVRSGVVTSLCALLTAVGHVAGGGAVPDLGVLVVLTPLLAGLFVTVAERAAGLAGLLAVLATGQFALHLLLELLHPAHHVMGAPGAGVMWTMHAAVTLVTAVALRHADMAVRGVRAALRRVARRRVVPRPAERPLPALAGLGPAVSARLARAMTVANVHRGPPVERAVALTR